MKWIAFIGVLALLSGSGGQIHKLIDILSGEASQAARGSSEQGCSLQKQPVIVDLSASEYPGTTSHIRAAWRAGEPRILHLDRAAAEGNRDESLQGIPTRQGYDRDEWPMAASREGGEGAHVAYVPSSDNRGAGASVGGQLEGWCSGQAFRVRITG